MNQPSLAFQRAIELHRQGQLAQAIAAYDALLERWPAHAEKVISFFVQDSGLTRGGYTGHWIGQVRPVLPWTTSKIDGERS